MMPSPLVKSKTAAGHRRGGDEGTAVASGPGIISANPFDVVPAGEAAGNAGGNDDAGLKTQRPEVARVAPPACLSQAEPIEVTRKDTWAGERVPFDAVLLRELDADSTASDADGCLLWNGALETETVSRLSWIGWNGPVPDGMHVLHKCDTRRCRAIDHLFLGANVVPESCGLCPVFAPNGGEEGNGFPSAKGEAENCPSARRNTSNDSLAHDTRTSQCEDGASPGPQDTTTIHESCGGTPSDRASETLEATVSEGPAPRYATGDAGTAPTGSLATALTDVASRCEPGPQDLIQARIAALEADLATLKANLADALRELLARIEAGEGR